MEKGRCPCGKPVGPEFRYGACDGCAAKTPPSVMLLWGMELGKRLDAEQRASAARKVLTELLRLYDWRFELAERELRRSGRPAEKDFDDETARLLRQYGREKKAAWEAVRRVLRATPRPDRGEGADSAESAPGRESTPKTPTPST